MKRLCKTWLSLCLCLMLAVCGCAALAEAPAADSAAVADWTVLIYLCGTDLETNNQMATLNLREIAQTTPSEQVNVVIETGGTRKWHAAEAIDGLNIAADKLQRYQYDASGFTLVEEQPLASMASAETLSDFVRWGTQRYPAQKTMLLLWDHGGGSFGGIISDELHHDSIMSLEDVGRALKDAEANLEAIVMDACLMASLETAQMVQPYAHYLIASEELDPSEGSAFTTWLQYLYDTPSCDGSRFGRVFCDSIQQKYMELGQTDTNTLTFSTIDLTKLDAVSAAFDRMFTEVGELLDDPTYFNVFGYYTQHAQSFSMPQMIDLADLAVKTRNKALSNETAGAVLEAVENAVVYCIKGSAHSYSHGLSFYYAPQESVYRLDHFARCCRSAPYLAFLDRASMSWTAPEWVYQQVERKPDISREDYIIEMQSSIGENGVPTLTLTNAKNALAVIDVELFDYNEESDVYHLLGADVEVAGDFDSGVFSYQFPGVWPALQGAFCQMSIKDELDEYTLYRVPFIPQDELDACIERGKCYELRVGLIYDDPILPYAEDGDAAAEEATDNEALGEITGEYMLYGVWNNTTSSASFPGRDVWKLDAFDGENLILLRDNINPYTGHVYQSETQETITLNAAEPGFVETDLPSGIYGMVFVVTDVLGNSYRSDPIRIEWDGSAATYAMME